VHCRTARCRCCCAPRVPVCALPPPPSPLRAGCGGAPRADTPSPLRTRVWRGRHVGLVAVAAAALLCASLAVAVSWGPNPSRPVALESILGNLNMPFSQPSIGLSMTKAREDIDPGSLSGLLAAAQGKDDAFGSDGDSTATLSGGRTTQLGEESAVDELASIQQKMAKANRPSARAASSHKAAAERTSLGKTIAQYFTTVRSVKDDQGTFLG